MVKSKKSKNRYVTLECTEAFLVISIAFYKCTVHQSLVLWIVVIHATSYSLWKCNSAYAPEDLSQVAEYCMSCAYLMCFFFFDAVFRLLCIPDLQFKRRGLQKVPKL